MREIKLIVPVGMPLHFGAVGDYIRFKSGGDAITIEAPDTGEFLTMEVGDAVILSPFSRLSVSHSHETEQAITLLIGSGTRSESSTVHKIVGSIKVENIGLNQGAMACAGFEVTDTAQFCLAENPGRRFLMIQNKNALSGIWVNVGGVDATPLNGVAIGPGGSLIMDAYVPSGSISVVGSVASNPDVVVVEG